jgi:hypothetical protein
LKLAALIQAASLIWLEGGHDMIDPMGMLLMPFHGILFHHHGLFKECDHFLLGDHSIAEKILVLNMLLAAMGEPQTADEDRVAAYIAFANTL